MKTQSDMKLEQAIVQEHERFTDDYKLLKMKTPAIGPRVKPGQFIHLRVPHMNETVLRRPFSIFKADEEGVSILYKNVGAGTEAMQQLQPGDEISLLGPLGTGFPQADPSKYPILVAGGYGMAALYLTAAQTPTKGIAFFGGRSASDILCVNDFEALGWEVRVATENGTLGTQGLVTEALDPWLENNHNMEPELFACGPNPMLKAVSDRAQKKNVTAWISMDRHMGCGVGACLTCVQKIKAPEGGWVWARVCKEGPVFECRDIVWEE